jgi:hypothetical protein
MKRKKYPDLKDYIKLNPQRDNQLSFIGTINGTRIRKSLNTKNVTVAIVRARLYLDKRMPEWKTFINPQLNETLSLQQIPISLVRVFNDKTSIDEENAFEFLTVSLHRMWESFNQTGWINRTAILLHTSGFLDNYSNALGTLHNKDALLRLCDNFIDHMRRMKEDSIIEIQHTIVVHGIEISIGLILKRYYCTEFVLYNFTESDATEEQMANTMEVRLLKEHIDAHPFLVSNGDKYRIVVYTNNDAIKIRNSLILPYPSGYIDSLRKEIIQDIIKSDVKYGTKATRRS